MLHDGCAGRRVYGVAIIASKVWSPCLVQFTPTLKEGYFLLQLSKQLTHLYDELACTGDAQFEDLVDYPALQAARRCECSDVNVVGRLREDNAAAFGLVFKLATCMVMWASPPLLRIAQILGVTGGVGLIIICSKEKKRKDYAGQVWLRALRKGPLTSKLARASPRRFAYAAFKLLFVFLMLCLILTGLSVLSIFVGWDVCVRKHEQQDAYVGELERNLEMPVQLEAALDAGNIETTCFCLRSWLMQARSEHNLWHV
eukprot:1161071-Pelagomonas_calceolata.AAC.11